MLRKHYEPSIWTDIKVTKQHPECRAPDELKIGGLTLKSSKRDIKNKISARLVQAQ
jgi:hypothetical protein